MCEIENDGFMRLNKIYGKKLCKSLAAKKKVFFVRETLTNGNTFSKLISSQLQTGFFDGILKFCKNQNKCFYKKLNLPMNSIDPCYFFAALVFICSCFLASLSVADQSSFLWGLNNFCAFWYIHIHAPYIVGLNKQ